jgi:hypothetical protein
LLFTRSFLYRCCCFSFATHRNLLVFIWRLFCCATWGRPTKKTGSYQRTDSTNITATLYSIQMDLVLWHQEFNNFFHIFCNSSLLVHTRFSALQSFPFKTKSGDLVFSFTPGMMIILQILLKLLLKNDFGRIFDSFNLLFCYAC